MQLEDLKIFVTTLNTGSFTAAANKLGLTKQLVSRRIMALEASIGCRLLNRTTRQLRPTELGLTLLDRATQILADVEQTRALLTCESEVLRGTLRVSAPMTFGILYLGSLLPDFMKAHPDLCIELDLNDQSVNLIDENYDMAIRIGILEDSTLIAQRLSTIPCTICASPEYLKRRGNLQHPRELVDHDCLPFGFNRQVEWIFYEDNRPFVMPITGLLRANNGEVLRDAAIAGQGIIYLPNFIIEPALKDGRLVPLFNERYCVELRAYGVYPQHKQPSRAAQALIEFLRSRLANLEVPDPSIHRRAINVA